jgi:hypothetical protein
VPDSAEIKADEGTIDINKDVGMIVSDFDSNETGRLVDAEVGDQSSEHKARSMGEMVSHFPSLICHL